MKTVALTAVALALAAAPAAHAASWEPFPTNVDTVTAYCRYARTTADTWYRAFGARVTGWRCGRVAGPRARPTVRISVRLNRPALGSGRCGTTFTVVDFNRHRSLTKRETTSCP